VGGARGDPSAWTFLNATTAPDLTILTLDKGDVAAVAKPLEHDVPAIALEPGDRAGVVVGLQDDVLDPRHLFALLLRADSVHLS
jgi:hypothetical protein